VSVQQTLRRHREPRHVVRQVRNHVVPKPKPERHAMSIDEERALIKARVQSFCGRHPKDVACQPVQAEPPKEP
jgi:hypothetical protein